MLRSIDGISGLYAKIGSLLDGFQLPGRILLCRIMPGVRILRINGQATQRHEAKPLKMVEITLRREWRGRLAKGNIIWRARTLGFNKIDIFG